MTLNFDAGSIYDFVSNHLDKRTSYQTRCIIATRLVHKIFKFPRPVIVEPNEEHPPFPIFPAASTYSSKISGVPDLGANRENNPDSIS